MMPVGCVFAEVSYYCMIAWHQGQYNCLFLTELLVQVGVWHGDQLQRSNIKLAIMASTSSRY